ncbi:MAG: DUF4097 family beta strand repeat protein [Vallitaleaceae bacterium]|nr:DUF4097 family beta strand repeat protein [Vallitaleaceae bacterium]
MRKIVLLSVMMLVAVILSTGCMSPGRSKTEKETITLKDTDLISIEASSADIEVISEDREDISVVLNTYERGPKLKVSGGKTVHIAAESQRGIHVGVTFSYSPRMTIYVP